MSNEELKKLKNEELEILDYFVEICKKNNLRYYIMYGTLLGAVRHHGFIPWDDDVDVCMTPSDYQKFIKIFKNDDKFFLQTIESDKYFHTLFAKIRKNNTCMVEKENGYMKINKGINIDMVDINERAISLVRDNLTLNKVKANAFSSDVYSNVNKKYDYIITNPPIRAGKEVVRKFLLGGYDYLNDNGILYFVMRKDHGVKSMIKELENKYNVTIINKDKGFYIVSLTKHL